MDQERFVSAAAEKTVKRKRSPFLKWVWESQAWVLLLFGVIVLVATFSVWMLAKNATLTVSTARPIKVLENATRKVILQEKFVYVHRYAVNKIVQTYMENGKSDEVLSFYTRLTGDKHVALLFLTAALSQDIPVNLFFALGKEESRFNPNAINKWDDNGTKDYGLTQLNSGTFSEETSAELLDPENNVRLGSTYLRKLYSQYHTWLFALVAYNGGVVNGVLQPSLQYASNILEIESQFDQEFASAF